MNGSTRLALMICIMAALTVGIPEALAATPHSNPNSCGYVGGPGCPPPTPTPTPWLYHGAFTDTHNSLAETAAYEESYYTTSPNDWCTWTLTSITDDGSAGSDYGFDDYHWYWLNYYATYYTNSTPACSGNKNSYTEVYGTRTVICPSGGHVSYQTSPLVGPYCVSPPPVSPPKQPGSVCPRGCRSGSTSSYSGAADAGSGRTIAEEVDASNGNLGQTETDYSGVGSSPLSFSRTYDSLAAANSSSLLPTTQWMGVGWFSSYSQFLLPVSVTDSTGTYNTVYAYRPDGRLLKFNEYSGTYSPDGDVADSLMQTSSGWQYQTANDTIETYNSLGQLTSIALRGGTTVTVNYAATAVLGDPPTSVSDAFGHTLQFSYLTDATKATRLASITDPAGRTISYAYDSYGNLITVTNADSTTRSYSYGTYPSEHLLSTLTDEASVAYRGWTYNGSEQPATSQRAGGVDSYSFSYSTSGTGGSVSVTDPLGKSRTYNQSLIWGAYRMTSSSALCPECDASRVYDGDGNITSRTDFNGNQTTYVYNAQTNLETSRTEAYGTSNARTMIRAQSPLGRSASPTTQWATC
jgi:YD repeat-containing protein